MERFLKKTLIFLLPIIVLVVLVTYIDFFKIFGFQDYYANQKIGLNRGMITTTTYNHFRSEKNFNSFIFGSSRSQAYKCSKWTSFLDENAQAFHFDASDEGVLGISQKVEYVDELGDTIKNALVVVDRSVLSITYPRENHLLISMPCVSKSSEVAYYSSFLKASLNVKFLIANLDYSIFNTHREYMGHLIKKSKFKDSVNKKNCDIWYGWDKEIETDSLRYYQNLIEKGVFYERPKIDFSQCPITAEEKNQLLIIKNIFDKHNTNYKFVISPTYDQISMEKEQVKLLEDIFGKEHVFDFSGKNKLTEPIHNYYENSHYRPHVADEIMKVIYQNGNQ